jgi:hypothetical protein
MGIVKKGIIWGSMSGESIGRNRGNICSDSIEGENMGQYIRIGYILQEYYSRGEYWVVCREENRAVPTV